MTSPEQQNNAEFFRPPEELLGLKLRPYTAGTSALMDQARWVLRQHLDGLYGTEPAHDAACADDKCADRCPKLRRNYYAHFYYLAAWLYIHSQPLPKVCQTCWKPEALLPALTEFLAAFSEKDILASNKAITAIEDAARRADEYKIEGGEGEHPNE